MKIGNNIAEFVLETRGKVYTGQEAQTPDFSTGYTDFGARQYSPTLRRWMTPDPLSEKYYDVSPYAFCNNNPVNFVDPDGRIIGTLSGAILGGGFWGISAYRKGESINKGIVSGVVSGTITGAAVDLTIASGGTLAAIFGASVVGGATGGVVGEIAGNAVIGENTTILDVVEAGHDGAFAGAVSGTISAGSQVLSTAAKGTVNGLFNGVDDIKSALPNASDEVVSEISERVLQSEQQALKSINKTQFIFEASAETIYFIQDEIEKDDE